MGERLDKLYTDILQYCSLAPNDKGEVEYYFIFDKKTRKVLHVDKKLLLMPTKDNLKRRDVDETLIFHPLQELANRGESDIVKALRHQLNLSLNYVTMTLMTELLGILAQGSAVHREFTPEQRELLLAVDGSDPMLTKRFSDLMMKKFPDQANRLFCNVYLKKAGTFRGEKHSRVGIVQFPIYEVLKEGDPKLKKDSDVATLTSLVEFIFPGSSTDPEAFNSFSDSRDAPWLDCLLKTSYNLAQRLNELVLMYRKYIPDYENLLFHDAWVEPMENLAAYRDEILLIPAQSGNSGELEAAPAKTTPAAIAAAAEESGRFMPAPKPKPAPTQAPAAAPPGYPQPGYPQPPQQLYDAMGRPVPPQYAQLPPQPMPPAPAPGLAYTENGKLDFRSVSSVNPAVAMAGSVATPLTQWQRSQSGWQAPMPPGYGYPPGYQVDPRVAPVAAPQFTGVAPGYQAYPVPVQPVYDAYGRPVQAAGYPMPYPGGIVPM